ncbi:hypothetical protein KC19_VG074000 [Ceratodon purpureus]|uniref:Uncharacterized protein n=1 Tax=Ceratodon purpureus TaxID=3225 RepID=A0A8T0HNI2_CERPU|nr:hypothetical protein KC19_VG074000 [Ceratodon purpureus]
MNPTECNPVGAAGMSKQMAGAGSGPGTTAGSGNKRGGEKKARAKTPAVQQGPRAPVRRICQKNGILGDGMEHLRAGKHASPAFLAGGHGIGETSVGETGPGPSHVPE